MSAASAQTRRTIVAAIIGNGLIVYDFTIYSFSAVIIGQIFFPSGSPLTSLLMSLATFGAGFVMRPLGAMLISHLADRKGRKAGLTCSIALMTLGTALIAFTPGYATIGVTATLLIVIARLLQGLAAGGEIGTASAALIELSHRDRRCYLVSWRAASQGAAALLGALLGALTSTALSPAALHDWGWRIPFVFGLLIGPVGWYLRQHMVEAPLAPSRRPRLRDVFVQHRRTLGYGILLMAAPSASIYIMVFYMPTYLIRVLGMSPTISLLSSCLAGTVILIGTPLLARIADRQQRLKPILYLTLSASIVLIYPAFLALTQGVGELASLLIIGAYAAVALSNGGASSVLMLEAFPRHQRASGMSMIYSFGVTVFGGFSPFIVTWLIGASGSPMAPAWYLLAALGISLLALRHFPEAAEDRAEQRSEPRFSGSGRGD